jgi:hypothetical protein
MSTTARSASRQSTNYYLIFVFRLTVDRHRTTWVRGGRPPDDERSRYAPANARNRAPSEPIDLIYHRHENGQTGIEGNSFVVSQTPLTADWRDRRSERSGEREIDATFGLNHHLDAATSLTTKRMTDSAKDNDGCGDRMTS